MNCGKERLPYRGMRRGVLLLLASLLLAGCGYRFAGEEESVSPAFRTVFVDTFTNQTGEAYAESIFRSAFISRFVQEGRFKLARSRGEADMICRGTVRSLQAAPLAYKANNLTAEDRITVTLGISFEERESGRVIWADWSFVGTGDYPVTTVGVTESSRKNALVKLANDSAERVYRLMMSGF
jgi:Lipopolysaccharide-assembly